MQSTQRRPGRAALLAALAAAFAFSTQSLARESLQPITRSADTSAPAEHSDPGAFGAPTDDASGNTVPVAVKGVVTSEPAPAVVDDSSSSSSAIDTMANMPGDSHAATETAFDRTPATTATAPVKAANTTAPAKATPAAKTPTASTGSTAASSGVSAEQSLRWLTNGNIRFVKKNFRKDGRSEQDRKRLLEGQKPHAIVLSCADSRVPPEIVFDQALGEIFTIRVAGEALDDSVIASIEYAVEHLGPKLLVVMGHTQCGAVKATLTTKEGESAGSEHLDKLIADIRPHLKTVSSEKTSPNLEIESTLNADGVARDLVHRSEIIRKKVEAGELKIKPALYRMDSGKVSFY